MCTTCPIKRVTFQPIIHSTLLKTNKRASAPIKSMFPAKYRRNMARNIPSHQLPNKSPDSNRRDSLRLRISVLSVQSSTCVTNKSSKKVPHTFPSQQNSPTTSTPFTTKPNKPKAKPIRRSGNKTISSACTYKCDECPKSFLSQRGLKIHLSVHRKAAQANTNNTTKNTTIWLRSAFQKKLSLKDMRF